MEGDLALRLTAYLGERDRTAGGLLAHELMDICEGAGVASSILLRGTEGFGLRHGMQTQDLLTLSEDLPLAVIALDAPARIEELLARIRRVSSHGVMTLERARLDRASRLAGETAADGGAKLTLFVGRQQRARGRPAHLVAVDCLRRHGVHGANVLLGLDGTADGVRRRARFLARNREVPLMILAVGDARAVTSALGELAQLLDDPRVALERVEICKRDGELLSRPVTPPGEDDHGRPYWQKLVVYAAEDARHHGEPLHGALVRRLRREGAAGATTLRAQWGYHGRHRPAGERLWSVARRTPALTVILDEPANVGRWFEVVDELTAATGLVTSEVVPALRAAAPQVQRGGLHLAGRFTGQP